jgi:Na+-translocating ferredoxin:NAD+ oxidoreductase RNF subunit RnfB
MADECILCGNCFVACPQKAKEIRSDIETAGTLLKSGASVYVSVAPSFMANYAIRAGEKNDRGRPASIGQMENALKKLGFAGAEETALGAAIVKRRYDEMIDAEEQDVIISSCCPSVNLLIQKYYPEALSCIAPVLSPMEVHCADIKRRHPGAKTLFAGPCISKKAEAEMYGGQTDCVLTFMELSLWFEKENIKLDDGDDDEGVDEKHGLTRAFPTSAGILHTMEKKNPHYMYLSVDGIDNCKTAIEDILEGRLGKCFVEMSACTGSCIGGPAMEKRRFPLWDYMAVRSHAGDRDFMTGEFSAESLRKTFKILLPRKIHLGKNSIDEVLRKIGKTRPEDELNCGTCGYNTCRDKAQAVLEGKANLTMCLPYLIAKAESFSDNIITNTPNGIIVLNETMEVQQINTAACRLLNIRAQDILGDQVVRILDPLPFMEVCRQGKNIYNRRVYLADYEKHIDQTIIYDKNYRIIIGIMRDITEDAARRSAKEEFNRNTIDITNKVIEKQMRAVHEIASLLGETTAETKVALTKLKQSLSNE